MKKLILFFILTIFLSCSEILLVDTFPTPGSIDVSLDTEIRLMFSVDIDFELVKRPGYIYITDGKESIEYSIRKDRGYFILTPKNELKKNTKYEVILSKKIASNNGEKLIGTLVLPFTTTREADTESPTITVTQPTENENLKTIALTVTGTSDDNTMVKKVMLSLDSEVNYIQATGTTNWSKTFYNLTDGQHIIRAYSVDSSNNKSEIVEVNLNFNLLYAYYFNIDENATTLKQDLHNLIDNHIELPYNWDCTEVDYKLPANREGINPPNSVISCYYKNETTEVIIYDHLPTYNLDKVTREHTVPKSWMKGVAKKPEGTDLHNLISCDQAANSSRNNKPYGEGNTVGCYNTVPDWHKGDAARIYFYMCIRYMGDTWDGYSLNGTTYLTKDINIGDDYEAMLRQWHIQDPPDAYEIERNNRVYAKQGNRNPFVDHPDWVQKISDF